MISEEKIVGDGNRTQDEFGFLTVENCVLTGEDVAKYFGYEIPYFKQLGLERDKVYDVYRPKEEIKDSNFSNKPLLSNHADFSAEDYKYKLIVGTIGDTYMDGDQTKGTVVIWSEKAIDELEKGKKFLSCGYMYDPVLESGFYNNTKYDIKMVNIVANHVAMVDNPRYKRAIVADEQTITEGNEMLFSKKKTLAKDKKDEEWGVEEAMDAMKDCMMSKDSEEEKEKKMDEIKARLKEKLEPKEMSKDKKDSEGAPSKKEKEEGAMDKKDEELEDKEQKKNEEEEGLESAGKGKKMTGDSDYIRKLVADSVAAEILKIQGQTLAFDSAIREYERTCGKANRAAFDSAEKVLNTILKNHRVTFDGKSFEQKQAMVEMLPASKNNLNSVALTIDSESTSKSHTPAKILQFLKERA